VLTLIHELQGAQANVVLVNAAGVIVDALKRTPATTAVDRAMLPGQMYRPRSIPPQRLLVSAVTLAHLQALHQQGQWHTAGLQRLVMGLTPLLAAELLYRSQGDPQQCWELLHRLRQHYEAQTLSLSVCTTPDGSRHLTVLPLTHLPGTCETFAQAQDAVAAVYQPALVSASLAQARSSVQKTVNQRLRKLRKKIDNLRRDQQKLESYVPYQHYGTLLLSQQVPRGATQASVVDYYHPEQPTISIPLDPRLSVRDNAQAYFKKYRKARGGLTTVQGFLTQCSDEERYLERLAQQVVDAEEWQTLEAIAAELGASQAEAIPRRGEVARPKPAVVLPYRTFISRDGYILYCGKSNQGNEALLRQVAAPEDLWLHAHQHAGAHVVVKVQPHAEVPPHTLRDAAALAAFYSKGKNAATVEVLYTQVKHVRKFRGARPGQVQVRSYRTLEVAPQLPVAWEPQETSPAPTPAPLRPV
jgi:predicted ribosome quality control (RQC) complex YloA/Tae2 family protein